MNVILAVLVALLVFERHVEAELYDRNITEKDLKELGLKCIPGRTTIRVEEKPIEIPDSDSESHEALRTHMNAASSADEPCQICVCSEEGKDEYCSRRPARNVNECLRMSRIKKEWESNIPYDHSRILAYRIRRDYIWHDDEIPYNPKAACRRGRSYYSNSITANDTDIDVASDIDSLLDYSNKDVCFYCICSTGGQSAGCIARNPLFCEYYRIIRRPDAMRDNYRALFKQDRPAYFRTLSYRIRRKMDEGIFDFMEHVGNGLDESKCVPFVSQYSDCTEANVCSGCTRCTCGGEGQWRCERVLECPDNKHDEMLDDLILDNALDNLMKGYAGKGPGREPGPLVPAPPNPEEDLLLVPEKKFDLDEELKLLLGRQKRSADDDNHNSTVKFYETVDEINKDTLKNFNFTGTLEAQKVNAGDRRKVSRRTNTIDHNNNSDASALHIEYSQPHELEHHIAENKVDSKHPVEDKINGLSHEEIHKILGNYSNNVKNKDLSKLVVKELTRGTETIGDKNVVPVSNITFTPENDTLTAMTFIAGNLLNKLWEMEKDTNEGFFETEEIKHEKINSLLDLFKEPLSIRQESFLKNALEKLSRVIDENQGSKNFSICANIEEAEETVQKNNNCSETSKSKQNNTNQVISKPSNVPALRVNKGKVNPIDKVNDVLNLIKKYENLQKSLKGLKGLPESNYPKSIDNDNISLNLFGKVLSKITDLLLPNKSNKRIMNKIKMYNLLRKDDIAKKNIEKLFDIDLANISVTNKDKMLMDYLSNVENHPNCFFSHLKAPVITPLSNVEGSILYNLSEFFKIKSFSDLMKLLNDQPDSHKVYSSTPSTTLTTVPSTTTTKILRSNAKNKPDNLESTKEKLKNDIKTILQDLIELQKEHGIKTKTNINIADALPCIYNMLNVDPSKDNSKIEVVSNPLNKIKSFIDALKFDTKFMSPSRRVNAMVTARPKSAIVWERAIKNLDKLNKPTSRRSLDELPKSYKELREMMDKAELSSNTYKNKIIQSGVVPSERLILLKTLLADVKQYTDVLGHIKQSLGTITNLPLEKQNDFLEFVNNAAMNINLNRRVVELVEKFKRDSLALLNVKPQLSLVSESKQSLVMPKWDNSNENNGFKLSRDQIMNQLIMNRILLYIKSKEQTGTDVNADVSYNIAKRIILNLEAGNVALAKELYKAFEANTQHLPTRRRSMFTDTQFLVFNNKEESIGPKLLAFKDPLVRIDDPKRIKMLSQDYFRKQMWNLKGMKE